MTASHARLHSSSSPEAEPRKGWLDRLSRAAGGTGALRPAALSVPAGFRRRSAPARESAWRHARAADALHSEEDRMRLVAALLVLATLLLWMLFLRG